MTGASPESTFDLWISKLVRGVTASDSELAARHFGAVNTYRELTLAGPVGPLIRQVVQRSKSGRADLEEACGVAGVEGMRLEHRWPPLPRGTPRSAVRRCP